MNKTIRAYNASQSKEEKAVCQLLAKELDRNLPAAVSRLWHGHPVWFLADNPIAGYSKLKDGIRLLFWSGRSFDEPGLKPEGTFRAAEVRFTSTAQINLKDLRRWLNKSKKIQWDYKNIVKRKGVLVRLK